MSGQGLNKDSKDLLKDFSHLTPSSFVDRRLLLLRLRISIMATMMMRMTTITAATMIPASVPVAILDESLLPLFLEELGETAAEHEVKM